MEKVKLFLDFDDCIVHSSKSICKTYNEIFKEHPSYQPANWWENTEWNYSKVCPLMEHPSDLFSFKLFFDYLEFMNENTKEVVEELCEKYEVIIASIGTPENVSYKSLWIEKNLPSVKDCVLLINNGCKMNKSIINMKDGIFIDDVLSNLNSSNAMHKIIFGEIESWNVGSNYTRAVNWTDINRLLLNKI